MRHSPPGSVSRCWVVVFLLLQTPSHWQMRHRSRLRSHVLNRPLGIRTDVSQSRKSHQNVGVPDRVVLLMFLVSGDMVLIKGNQRLRFLCYVSVCLVLTFVYSPHCPFLPRSLAEWHAQRVLTAPSRGPSHYMAGHWHMMPCEVQPRWSHVENRANSNNLQKKEKNTAEVHLAMELSEQWWHRRTLEMNEIALNRTVRQSEIKSSVPCAFFVSSFEVHIKCLRSTGKHYRV